MMILSLPSASTFSGDVDGLVDLVSWMVGIWFFATQIMFFWLLWRFRARPGVKSQYEGMAHEIYQFLKAVDDNVEVTPEQFAEGLRIQNALWNIKWQQKPKKPAPKKPENPSPNP